MTKQRALIIGGSVGGLFAANMLRSIGWDADGVRAQRRGALRPRRRHQHASAIARRHRRLGIPFDNSMGISDRQGGVPRPRRPALRRRATRCALMSSWGRVFRSLRDPIPDDNYRLGKSLVRVEQDADGVTAIFADGTRERGDHADRRRRRALDGARAVPAGPAAAATPAMSPGARCWTSAMCRPASTRNCSTNYTYCLPPGELFLAYPVPGRNNETQPGQRAYNIVWYRPTTPEQLADLCTDASGKCHGTSIPPPLIRPDVIAWSKAQARALVAPQVAEIFERDPRPFFQAIFDFDLAADRVRPRGAAGRCGVPGAAASRRRHHQVRDGCRAPRRRHRRARHRGGACELPARARRVRQRAGAAGPASTAPTSPTSSNRASSGATRT